MKLVLSWSSGKDSAWALHALRRGDFAVAALLSTVAEADGRVPMHHVPEALLDAQAAALGLPLIKVRLPPDCPNAVYEARMREGCAAARAAGATGIAFGDLFLADIREYRERMLAGTELAPVFPLWGRDTRLLAEAVITSVDTTLLDPAFLGRPFDRALLAALPAGADPCAENGEFHTFAHGGPMFARPMPVTVGERVDAGRFVYRALSPRP